MMGLRDHASVCWKRRPVSTTRAGAPGRSRWRSLRPFATQHDLALAYTPGVVMPGSRHRARPSRRFPIHHARQFGRSRHQRHRGARTGKSGPRWKAGNGGQGVLFKRFADVDVFDIEVDATTRTSVRSSRHSNPPSAASTSKTSRRRSASRSRRRYRGDGHPGLPRRPARDSHHLRRGPTQCSRTHGQGDRQGPDRSHRRRGLGHRLRELFVPSGCSGRTSSWSTQRE